MDDVHKCIYAAKEVIEGNTQVRAHGMALYVSMRVCMCVMCLYVPVKM